MGGCCDKKRKSNSKIENQGDGVKKTAGFTSYVPIKASINSPTPSDTRSSTSSSSTYPASKSSSSTTCARAAYTTAWVKNQNSKK